MADEAELVEVYLCLCSEATMRLTKDIKMS